MQLRCLKGAYENGDFRFLQIPSLSADFDLDSFTARKVQLALSCLLFYEVSVS